MQDLKQIQIHGVSFRVIHAPQVQSIVGRLCDFNGESIAQAETFSAVPAHGAQSPVFLLAEDDVALDTLELKSNVDEHPNIFIQAFIFEKNLLVENSVITHQSGTPTALVVLGNLTAAHIKLCGNLLTVAGTLACETVWGTPGSGKLYALGGVSAWLIFSDGMEMHFSRFSGVDAVVNRGGSNITIQARLMDSDGQLKHETLIFPSTHRLCDIVDDALLISTLEDDYFNEDAIVEPLFEGLTVLDHDKKNRYEYAEFEAALHTIFVQMESLCQSRGGAALQIQKGAATYQYQHTRGRDGKRWRELSKTLGEQLIVMTARQSLDNPLLAFELELGYFDTDGDLRYQWKGATADSILELQCVKCAAMQAHIALSTLPRELEPPTISFLNLIDALKRMPAQSRVPVFLTEDIDAQTETLWVAWIEGDLVLQQLDLDAPFAQGRTLRALLTDVPPTAAPFAVVVNGTLAVRGDVSSLIEDYAQDANGNDLPFPHLLVMSDFQARDVVVGGQFIDVRGAMRVERLLWGTSENGGLHVDKSLQAGTALFTDDFSVRIEDGENVDCLLDEVRDHARVNLLRHSSEALAFVFEASMLNTNGIDDGMGSAVNLLDREAIVLAVRANQSVLKAAPHEATTAAMPLVRTSLVDDAISVSNVRQMVQAAREVGIVSPNKSGQACWWGNTTFTINQRGTDSDGDPRYDSVYISVHKTCDFFISVHEPVAVGPLKRFSRRLQGLPAIQPDVLVIHYRGYTDEGEPEEFQVLDEYTEDGHAIQRCRALWAGVLDYLRKALGQARADYPLYKLLQTAQLSERIDALANFALFAQHYNDWDDEGDNDRMGYFEGEVFVAVRSAEAGGADGTAIKFCYEIGPLMAGEESYRNQCSFLITAALRNDQNDSWPTGISYAQRQGDELEILPLHAVDHCARLLRFFNQVEALARQRNEAYLAGLAQAERLVLRTQLQCLPPYAADTPDETIFSAEALAKAARWQHEGHLWVRYINDYQERELADALSTAEADNDLRGDPRKEDAEFVLQLARSVNSYHDVGLSERFHRLFPFSPDALIDHAEELGQEIGPVFWLAPGQAVVRVGEDYAEDRHWVMVNTGHSQVEIIHHLHGLGRSMNQCCWARSDGHRVSTHLGFDGPVIAYFSLPVGTEGLPPEIQALGGDAALRCDQLIPYNDGQRVLLRNRTGMYLLLPDRVQRLHPQNIDLDGGPYTWPKNQNEGLLDIDMGHMALSPDERFIAVGDQDSMHLLLDAATGLVLHEIEPTSDYPHHAVFSHDSRHVYLNACRFYNGVTQRVDLAALDAQPVELAPGWRVYTSDTLPGITLMGCANGYLHAIPNDEVQSLWRQHIGSSLSGIDVAPDGSELVVGSAGGYLVWLQPRAEGPTSLPRVSVGNAPYVESLRFIFPKRGVSLRW